MEREKELLKLINVLRRTARMAQQGEWTGTPADAAAYALNQYNRVLARLSQLDDGVGAIFEPLPAESSLAVTAMACRQLAAYYEDELGPAARVGRAYAFAFDPKHFKEFWKRAEHDVEDLGEFIRESIAEWFRVKKGHCETKEEKTDQSSESC